MPPKQPEAGDQQPVLSFHDSFLRGSDVATLERGEWLNDQIISFYLQYLEHNVYQGLQDDAAFLAAEVVQLVKILPSEELEASFGFLSGKKIVFIPLNNCDVTKAGGSHWSLMIFFDGEFHHLDSSNPTNEAHARMVCRKLSLCIAGKQLPLVPVKCPSQTNSSDCGVYVLEFTETACAAYSKESSFSTDTFKHITPESVSRKRSAIRDIIQKLRKDSRYSHV